MPRTRKKVRVEVEISPSPRDYVMARLAAARSAAADTLANIDEALGYFVDAEDDDGAERAELVASALENVGFATRALESAEEVMPQIDPEESEPWEGDDEEDDEPMNPDPPRTVARGRRSS